MNTLRVAVHIEVSEIHCTHCKPKKSPHFLYMLKIYKDATCNKTLGHEFHFDFTYVAEIKKIKDPRRFDRVVVKFDLNIKNKETIRAYLSHTIEEKIQQKGKDLPRQLFPGDIPDRLFTALQAYKKLTRLDHENK